MPLLFLKKGGPIVIMMCNIVIPSIFAAFLLVAGPYDFVVESFNFWL